MVNKGCQASYVSIIYQIQGFVCVDVNSRPKTVLDCVSCVYNCRDSNLFSACIMIEWRKTLICRLGTLSLLSS